METSINQQSITIVQQKKNLLIFPTISTILMIATYFFGLMPLLQIEALSTQSQISDKKYIIFFVILLVMFFIVGMIVLLFNAGLTACALKHIRQEPYAISLGFKTMVAFFGKLLLIKVFYDAIAVYVKFMRYWVDDWRLSSESINLVSGLQWSDAILLILPVLISENTTFLQTLKRSSQLIKDTWGMDVTLRSSGFNRLLSVLGLIAFLPVIIGVIIGGTTAIYIGVTITIILTIVKTIIHSSTQIISSAALYLFTTGVDVSPFFDTEVLKKSFRPLTKKELHAS